MTRLQRSAKEGAQPGPAPEALGNVFPLLGRGLEQGRSFPLEGDPRRLDIIMGPSVVLFGILGPRVRAPAAATGCHTS